MDSVHKSTKTLKELRRQAGLTQYELSQILDVREKTVSEWERGVTEPHIPPKKVLLLCDTLDCSLDELVIAIEQETINRI